MPPRGRSILLFWCTDKSLAGVSSLLTEAVHLLAISENSSKGLATWVPSHVSLAAGRGP